MNNGNRMPFPQGNEFQFMGSWIPITPEKQFHASSNPVPVNGNANWQELPGFSNGYVQDVSNYNGAVQNFIPVEQMGGYQNIYHNGNLGVRNRMINQIAGSSYVHAFDETAGWNSGISANLVLMQNAQANGLRMRSSFPNPLTNLSAMRNAGYGMTLNGIPNTDAATVFRPQVQNMHSEASSHILLNMNSEVSDWRQANSASGFLASQNHCSGINLPGSSTRILPNQIPQYGFPMPYNLNLPPAEVDADLSLALDAAFHQLTDVQTANNKSSHLKSPMTEISRQEKGKQVITYTTNEDGGNCDELLQNLVDSSSAVVSSPVEDKGGSDGEADQLFDLNKTPQSKTPKRRKHRPKVIKEGKPKKNKPSTPKDTVAKETPSGKRKYVRKKPLREPATEQAEMTRGAEDQAAVKSCRRALNFESNNNGDERWGEMQQNGEALNLNSESQGVELRIGNDSSYRENSTMLRSQQNIIPPESNQQTAAMYGLTSLMNQRLATSYAPVQDLRSQNSQVISRNGDARNADYQNMQPQGIGEIVLQARNFCENLDETKQFMPQHSQSVQQIKPSPSETRGSKREYCHTYKQMQPSATDQRRPWLRHGSSSVDGYDINNGVLGGDDLRMLKRNKIKNGLPNIHGAGQVNAICENNVNANRLKSARNPMILNPHFARRDVINIEDDGYNHSTASLHNFNKQYNSGPGSVAEIMAEAKCLTQASLTALVKCNFVPPTPAKISKQKQSMEPTPSKPIPSTKKGRPRQERKQSTNNNRQLLAITQGAGQLPMYPTSVDEIIHKISNLNLYGLEQHALVPYKGDGAIVPHMGVGFIKKRKPRPKVDLDPDTNRIWNLLMGIETSEGLEQTDEEKEKKWEEEREVFRGRADSFIARMHLVQGDRRFSKWKGSVVDSVIGVFLTQNVSDHLSSSAFMCLAARFPKKPINRMPDWDETNILVEEPEVCILEANDPIKWNGKELGHPVLNESKEHWRASESRGTERKRLMEADSHRFEEIPSSQDSNDSSIIQGNGGVRSSSGSNSEAEDPITVHTPEKAKDSTCLPNEDHSISFAEFYNGMNGSPLFHNRSQPEGKQPEIDYLSSSSTFTNIVNFGNLPPQAEVATSSIGEWEMTLLPKALQLEGFETYGEECISSCSYFNEAKDVSCTGIGHVANHASETIVQLETTPPNKLHSAHQQSIGMRGCQLSNNQPYQIDSRQNGAFLMDSTSVTEPVDMTDVRNTRQNIGMQHVPDVPKVSEKIFDVEKTASTNNQTCSENKMFDQNPTGETHSSGKKENKKIRKSSTPKKAKAESKKIDWDSLRKDTMENDRVREKCEDTMDYEALRRADVKEISDAIKERGMNNMLAERIQAFLDRIVEDHGSIDLEWLRDVPPEKVKDYLLSVRGLGLKSVECVRLLTLHHLAFPVDTNVGRIVVRLGWVPLQPLPESLQLHLLEMYPLLETIQKYLWPRLCKLDQRTLYELHYQMITFGKVFCTKSKPNCNACPMRGECRHFASAFASARLALPGPEEKSIVSSVAPHTADRNPIMVPNLPPLCLPVCNPLHEVGAAINKAEPIIEEPASPEPVYNEILESDIEDAFYEDPDEIPTIKLNIEEFTLNIKNYVDQNKDLQVGDLSKALVALNPECASIPAPKLKNISRLRTEHYVYELPDSHPLIKGMDRREPDDPSPYLLAIWTPGETAGSIEPPEHRCESQMTGKFCNVDTCFSCSSIREANSQTVRGTILIPCRSAMRGSFPLNGTYFQVNEVFADHESSVNPIDVPREWIWKLTRRVVYFGTSVTTIFKGLTTQGIQYCFWRGFVCVRGFDYKSRAPRPLMARLHYPASRAKNDTKSNPPR